MLSSVWRLPSLSVHGIEGAFSDRGAKTVIPKKVVGKFSIRIVADQKPDFVVSQVIKYLDNQWNLRNSPNKYKVTAFTVIRIKP